MIGSLLDASPWILLAADEIDLDKVYGPNEIQTTIAMLIAGAAILVSALYVRFHSSRILNDEEADHAHSVTTGLRSRDRTTLRISHDQDVDEQADRIRALFDNAFTSDVPSVLDGLAEVRGVWLERRRKASKAVKGEIPALARALSLDAVIYLLAGVVAVESLETWGKLFTASEQPPGPTALADLLTTVMNGTATWLVDLVATYPFAGQIWAFSFIGVIEGGSFLYEQVFLVAGVLLAGSIVVWVGDRLVANDVEPRLYRTKPKAVFGVVKIVAAIWLSGVIVASLLRPIHLSIGSLATAVLVTLLVGVVAGLKVKVFVNETKEMVTTAGARAHLGRLVATAAVVAIWLAGVGLAAFSTYSLTAGVWAGTIGLLASSLVGGMMGRRELDGAHGRLTAAYEQADDDGVGQRGTTAYVAARKVFGAFGVIASLIVPIYLVQSVMTGKAATIAEIALVESSIQVKATFAFVLLAVVAFAIIQTRPAWGELATAVRYALDRQGLRVALKTRGFPFLVVLLSLPMLLGVGLFNPLTAILLSVSLAIGVRVVTWLADRADHAYYQLEDEPSKPGRVFLEAVIVEDARGREIAVLDENGHKIAAPIDRLDELVDQSIADMKSIFDTIEPEPSPHEHYFERIRDGKVDFDDVLSEYRGLISKTIDVHLENAGRTGIDVERLDELVTDEYDADLYRQKRLEKRKKPNGIVIYDGKVRSN